MPTNSAFEQLILELINRYRMDPQGEYDRLIDENGNGVQSNIENALNFFGVDLTSLEQQLNSDEAVAPLAWNDNLAAAARNHSELMIQYDQQSHRVRDENGDYVEPGLGDRVRDAGYNGWSGVAENIYAYTRDALHGHAGFVIDWGYDDEDFNANGSRRSDWQTRGDGIQDPAGHRINILSDNYTEIGISVIAENDSSTDVGPYVMTQNFGNRFSYDAQILGVVIDDQDGDQFYDIGEGLGGVTITVTNGSSTYTTSTAGAGGYQLEVPAGTYDISFSGGNLGGTITKSVTISGQNVKVDARADEAGGVVTIDTPTAGNDDLVGTNGTDAIALLAGHDVYDALGGDDEVSGNGGRDTLIGGDGNDLLIGGNGHDLLIGDQQDGGGANSSAADGISEETALPQLVEDIYLPPEEELPFEPDLAAGWWPMSAVDMGTDYLIP